MRVLVLQHIACEPPGVFEDVLRDRGADLHRVELDEGEPLPDWRAFDAVVAMGGPMSANDDEALPWLTAEKQLIAEAVQADKPFWGVCLGVQLLAASLGARVYPGAVPEVGILPVALTLDGLTDPVFAGLPHEVLTLQWHGDTFDLPHGAVRLAGSPAERLVRVRGNVRNRARHFLGAGCKRPDDRARVLALSLADSKLCLRERYRRHRTYLAWRDSRAPPRPSLRGR